MRRALRARGHAWPLVLALFVAPAAAQPPAAGGFPHERHARLFPTCGGCHAGITTGDTAAGRPSPDACERCHDGTIRPRVAAPARRARSGLLRFDHRGHAAAVAPDARACTACHAAEGASWMRVRRAQPETCQGCHAHRATAHLGDDNRCAACHLPLARAEGMTAARIAALPSPPSHGAPGFAAGHAVAPEVVGARCATCHARESCARCHVDAATRAAVTALAPDARVAAVVRGTPPTHPTPANHRDVAWGEGHGAAAAAPGATCGVCHARAACAACHTGELGRAVIRAMPDGREGARGVALVLSRRVGHGTGSKRGTSAVAAVRQGVATLAGDTGTVPVRPHPADFARAHGAQAASGRLTCEGCHARRFCAECHAGEVRRGFHGANFAARHAPEAYGREVECASCHSTEVFCRGCHQGQGLASRAARSVAYHDGQPLWLLQHGQAARLGMQGCTSCHGARDCLRCHSQQGWGVNPHGPGFDAARLGRRARAMCARCHLGDPLATR